MLADVLLALAVIAIMQLIMDRRGLADAPAAAPAPAVSGHPRGPELQMNRATLGRVFVRAWKQPRP